MLNKKVEAAVYNANGKKVKDLFDATSSLQVLSFTLDVSGLDNGIYTVKTKFDDRNMTMDFKVEK
ncbi:MAG: T9SS type A sorting domain-containing protein [Chlorobi bacterium]|nr:T9SS type A sorting domain-containing protein [Chlorobiota bacterium]